jgi:GT2 family glycosyltransferase
VRQEFPWCPVVHNPVNGGWAGGNNVGARHALERGTDLVVLLNNDTVVAPDFVSRLTAAAEAHPEYSVLGPVIRFLDPPHEVQTDGCLFNRPARPGFFQRKLVPLTPVVAQPGDRVTTGDKGGTVPAVSDVDIVNGCCMMVRAGVFRRIGLIDERFFLIHEESDFCLRARRAGFRCGVISEALVWHKGSSSFKRTGSRWQRYYDARNLCLLLSKHAATHSRGRRPLQSLWEYLRYTYHRYSLEREGGQDDAALAVLEGLCDAAARRFGPFSRRPRLLLPLVRGVFNALHNRRMGRKEAGSDAAAIC